MRQCCVILAISLAVGGCAGRADMRSVASQSSAILNTAQLQATKYAEAQTRYEAGARANIASFAKMTAIGNQQLKAAQVTWIDSTMKSQYSALQPLSTADYQKMVDEATAAPITPTTITIDTGKVQQAVAKLNELAREPTLESQMAFLTQFVSSIVSAYQDAKKKAADLANSAANQMKEAAPVQ